MTDYDAEYAAIVMRRLRLCMAKDVGHLVIGYLLPIERTYDTIRDIDTYCSVKDIMAEVRLTFGLLDQKITAIIAAAQQSASEGASQQQPARYTSRRQGREPREARQTTDRRPSK